MERGITKGHDMETLGWDKNELSTEFDNCGTLSALITRIEDRLAADKKVLCHVTVNGLALSELDEARLAETKWELIDRVDIQFRSSDRLVEDAAVDLKTWIEVFKKDLLQRSEELRNKGTLSAFHFSLMVANFTWLFGAIQAMEGHRPEANWKAAEERFSRAIKEVEVAYKASDFVALADVIEYEVTTSLDQWRAILQTISPD